MQATAIKSSETKIYLDEFRKRYRAGTFDDDDLHNFIWLIYGYDIPRKSFCPEHDAPFGFVADCFFGRCPLAAAVVHGNRGGGKTLDTALLENAGMLLRDELEIYHYGSVVYQADKCYDYFTDFTQLPSISDQFTSVLRGNAETSNGSSLAIHSATMAAVSGPHPHWAVLDEVETLERRDVFEKFQGMSKTGNGNHALDIYTSTRDKAYGPFQRVLEWAGKMGVRVYKWCIWDVLETCPASDKCSDCSRRTRDRCQGRARKTTGFYPIQDFRDKSAKIDDDTWDAQYLCKRPQRTGAVYMEFNEDIHVPKEPIRYNLQHPVFLVGDPGWRAADKEKKRGKFVVADFQVDPYDRISVFRENRFIETTPYDAGRILAKRGVYPWKGLIWDTEDPGGARDFIKGLGVSIPVIRFDKGKIEPGIKEVRPFLQVRDDGTVGLLISKTCTDAIYEMLAYRYKDVVDGKPVNDNPEDVDDHFPDCLRYFVIAYQKTGSDRPIVGEARDIDAILEGY